MRRAHTSWRVQARRSRSSSGRSWPPAPRAATTACGSRPPIHSCSRWPGRASARYLELVDESPVPYRLDRDPIGLLAVALDEDEMTLGGQRPRPVPRGGRGGGRARSGGRPRPRTGALSRGPRRLARPPRPPARPRGPHGRARVDGGRPRSGGPASSSGSSADRARGTRGRRRHGRGSDRCRRGGRRHRPVDTRAAGSRSVIGCRSREPAAGSSGSTRVPTRCTASWPPRGGRLATGRWEDGAVRAGALEDVSAATSTLLHPATDGSLIAGSSRQPVLTPEAEEPGVPARIVRGAIRLVPSLAEAHVRSALVGDQADDARTSVRSSAGSPTVCPSPPGTARRA